MKGIKGDYPRRRQMAAEGYTLSETARALGLSVAAISIWAMRHNVRFTRFGHGPADAKPLRPLSRDWFAARLSAAEQADYRLLRTKGKQTVLEALAGIRRADLVAEVTSHRDGVIPRKVAA